MPTFFQAVLIGNYQKVNRLIKAGVDVNYRRGIDKKKVVWYQKIIPVETTTTTTTATTTTITLTATTKTTTQQHKESCYIYSTLICNIKMLFIKRIFVEISTYLLFSYTLYQRTTACASKDVLAAILNFITTPVETVSVVLVVNISFTPLISDLDAPT